jgi:uncharacterized protein (TIGR02466 family)
MSELDPSLYGFNNVFPTAVLVHNIQRDITEEEIEYIEEQLSEVKPNAGNYTSKNVNILDAPEMAQIRSEIQEQLDRYIQEVYQPVNKDIKANITISWANETTNGGFHHKHNHPNSFLSGVFYPITEESDKIRFHKPNVANNVLKIEAEEFNFWNSETWWFPTSKGDIYIFPSVLEHDVENIETARRVSIAFNTWISGTLGSEDTLTLLNC